RQLGNHVGLEGTSTTLDDARPVAIHGPLVENGGALSHGRPVKGLHKLSKSLLYLLSHAFGMVWIWRPVLFGIQCCARMIGLVHIQLRAGQSLRWVARVDQHRLRTIGDIRLLHIRLAAAHWRNPLSREVVIQRVEPFVRQRAGALGLGEVDYNAARLEVRAGPSSPARAESNAKAALKAERLGRHADDIG